MMPKGHGSRSTNNPQMPKKGLKIKKGARMVTDGASLSKGYQKLSGKAPPERLPAKKHGR